MALVRVFSPSSEPEQLAVVAMLEAHGIECLVKNGLFGSLYPGIASGPLKRDIMVPEDDLDIALELIRDFERES